MNEEELKKYIKEKFKEIHTKMLNKQFVSAGTLIRFRDACIEKGKLEQKKEELDFIRNDLMPEFMNKGSWIKALLDNRIKQLQKEIGGKKNEN